MSMIKLITSGSYEFCEPVVQQIKVSSRGLIGDDFRGFVKRAGACLANKLAELDLQPGEIPIHVIALGDEEHYGSNRNGDSFPATSCKRDHDSFVKHARWFRGHQNKNKAKSYGVIKMSAYNQEMGRIELIAALNGTKEAADRNGGLVADEEMDKLANDEPIAVSMATHVPYDICSGCGNRAKTRRHYCTASSCKYGGLRDNIAKVFEDGHMLHAKNPENDWFDLSNVFKPADRIAYVLGRADQKAAYLEKAASEHRILCGAELADLEGLRMPLWVKAEGPWDDPRVLGQMKIAQQLIDLEDRMVASGLSAVARAFVPAVQPSCRDIPDVRKGEMKLAHVTTALASADCLLPLRDFIALLAGGFSDKTATITDKVAKRLPGMFDRLASADALESRLRENPYLPEYLTTQSAVNWTAKQASAWSLQHSRLVERLQLSVIRQSSTPEMRAMDKEACDDRTEELAREYALYQLGFLYAKQSHLNQNIYPELVVTANFVAS